MVDSPAAPSPARERIMASALELFATDGFGSTSIKAVAKRAGVSPALIYTYFESKDELLRSVFEEGLRDVRSTLPAAAGAPADATTELEDLIRQSFAVVEAHQQLWRLLYALRSQPGVLERLGLQLTAWNETIEAELEGLCRRLGSARPEVAAKLLFALIDGMNQHRLQDPEGYPTEAVIDAATRLFAKGAANEA